MLKMQQALSHYAKAIKLKFKTKKQQCQIKLLLKEIDIKNTFQKRERQQMISNFMLTGLFTEDIIKSKTYKQLFSILSSNLYEQKSKIQNLEDDFLALKGEFITMK